MSSAAAPQDRALEFFTLRETEKAVRAIPEAARTTARRELSLAFQKRDAAETLWPRGSCAEALRLARASVETAATALETFASSAEARPDWVTRALAILETAKQKTAGRALPELEADARPDDEETFRTLADATIAVEAEVGPYLADPRQFARIRRVRIGAVAALVVLVPAFFAWWGHGPAIKEARASGQNGPDGPDHAIDGNLKTNWGLPDGKRGWLDLVLTSPRSVKKLHLVPYNSPFNNRFLKDVHVTAFLGEQPVQAVDYSFKEPPPGSTEPVWVDVPLNAPKCDRIRIDVSTFTGTSGAITEIEVD
jgi:hypothetical protein